MIIEKLKTALRLKVKSGPLSISWSGALTLGELAIVSPGEYEKQGIFVEAFGKGVFLIKAENLQILYALNSFNSKNLEAIEKVDVLLTRELELVREIEPALAVMINSLERPVVIKPSDLPLEGTKIIPGE